jgi:DNA-binding HxlR family transcriptional regulator
MSSNHTINPYAETCISRHVLDIISSKWTILIIHYLRDGAQRPSELRRAIGGISEKVLTSQLRLLETNGMVKREVYAVVPSRVEYSLTSLGKSLGGLTASICDWAIDHAEEISGYTGD